MSFDEAGLLNAFDSNRDLIYTTAAKAYQRGHKGSYDPIPADFLSGGSPSSISGHYPSRTRSRCVMPSSASDTVRGRIVMMASSS
ncbi:MAG TPA: hypothetical protein VIY51_10880 [Xanthobacteraceae bacterium]